MAAGDFFFVISSSAYLKALLIGLMSDAIPKAHKTEAINRQSVLLIFDS
ncbi:hypothetical protein ECTW09195_3072 [Escherichia coli TW09195]|nr:hypothetical protein ECFRIK1996_3002 [Escherichia coli FRIK1996]EIO37770.1 hypothetical protein ECPA41_3001 [Escherichia coli PA41]EIO96728.1 hypothetical protein ECTW09195_3072 [Escherichia coli TW09195]EIP40219.1 hypothetical protein ECEC4439_2890 [Escherichia coli EC4439]EKI87151.1 hypothetical protein ECEC1849_2821 [Escherichia coli EC1849]EKJ10886.1 hypothetical protein ECEC1864_3066 [Escherichia coli EC1864]EKV79765.1 hypothetical protein EC881467_3012 [Escherichia coli 88.1467]